MNPIRVAVFSTLATLILASLAIGSSGRGGIYGRALEGVCEHHEACLHGKLEYFLRTQTIDLAWDEATGRDMRHYPPDRIVEYHHMKLDMHFENLNDMTFTATETLTFTPIGDPTNALTLHAVGLDIHNVMMNGALVEHFHDGETLTVSFDPPLEVGRKRELIFDYTCRRPYDGLYFTPAREDAPHYTAEVHTQGQPEANRHWFIAHDFPNQMLTTELRVNVPRGFQVSGNGRLTSHDVRGDREVWHWLQDKPHVTYLVSLAIGKFERVDLDHDRVPMTVWTPPGTGHMVEQTYGNTGAMIDLFERHFGVEYPWARYDQLIIKNFMAGGMENTSATNMYPTAIFDERALLDRDLDGLISHELAHQWAGDLLTCKSWAHIWLNEGWATYSSALWFEERDGEDGLLDSMRRSFGVANRDVTTNDLAMVSPIYRTAMDTFRRRANPYPKGASILHMLRRELGEELFWEGTQLYFNRHQHQPVETNDLRYAYEEVSGRGLEWFFDQWAKRPGTPHLDVHVRYEPKGRELIVDIEQTQHIDWRTPAFRFTLPVWVRVDDEWEVVAIDVREKSTQFRRTLRGKPLVVAIDPYLHVLKVMDEDKPLAFWLAQLEFGPTIAARHDAVEAIGKHDSPEHVDLLTAIARDDSVRYTLRNTAVNALAGYGSPYASAALNDMLADGIEEARVRVTVVQQLKDEASLVDRFAEIANTDISYATRVAAIEALAHQETAQHADLIAELVHYPSQHEQVRNAALRALVSLDDPRGLDLAMQYAAYGHTDRARPVAIGVIADLADHDNDRAVDYLLPLLHDPEWRTVRAVGAALSRIGDERAIAPLRAMAENHRNPSLRESAERWLQRIADGDDDA